MTKEQKIQRLIKEMMEDISKFENAKRKLIGLEISAGLIGRLLATGDGFCRDEIDVYKYISDSRVASLCKDFLYRIEQFVEFHDGSLRTIVALLLEKTSRLGCLQIQNPKRFDPSAKMTRQ